MTGDRVTRLAVLIRDHLKHDLAAAGRAEQISDANLRFSMTIPDGFERIAQLPPDKPNWLYGFVKTEPDGAWFVIVVERLGGTLDRKRLDPRDAPAGFHARLHTVQWPIRNEWSLFPRPACAGRLLGGTMSSLLATYQGGDDVHLFDAPLLHPHPDGRRACFRRRTGRAEE
jgi:hypothetical protein